MEIIRRCSLHPLRVVCLRETLVSIDESVKQVLEDMIVRFDLQDFFHITNDYILGANGSYIFFRGCSDYTVESIKGLENVDICWFEEAQMASSRSLELLFPTIRKDGSQIVFTFNPYSRVDAVWQEFIAEGAARRDEAVILHVNFDSNPHFPESMEIDRQATLRNDPERYPHIWLGEPDDAGDIRRVLPYSLLRICLEAWPDRGSGEEGAVFVGLDVADTGVDKNALVARKGSCIYHVETWGGMTTGRTARRAHDFCVEHAAAWFNYDQGGPGAGVRSEMAVIQPAYTVEGFDFGGAVGGKDRRFTRGRTNGDYFARRNAQAGWALRLRAQNTERLVKDDGPIDRAMCLFIDPAIPHVENFLGECTQPEWKMNANGKLTIEKQPVPEGGGKRPPSPNRYDAAVMSFAYESRRGIRLD